MKTYNVNVKIGLRPTAIPEPPIIIEPDPPTLPIPPEPEKGILGERLGLGICAPNTNQWTQGWPSDIWATIDYMNQLEHLKMMSNSHDNLFREVYRRGLRALTRLYHPTKDISALDFVNAIMPKIDFIMSLDPLACFELWNEPNHLEEGNFTPESFAAWAKIVVNEIKNKHATANVFYPAMALPGPNGNMWKFYEAGRSIMHLFDGIGVHPYWQNFKQEHQNHKAIEWGETYKALHGMYPKHPLYITESGNANNPNPPDNHPYDYNTITEEFRYWFQEAYKPGSKWHAIIHSVSPFILWSPDTQWSKFFWYHNGRRPMCDLLRAG